MHVHGKMVTRGKSKFADYVLYCKPDIRIAIIEAKDNNHAVGDGMQQALECAEILNIPFVFSSNGDGFVFHDRTGTLPEVETTLPLSSFPQRELAGVTDPFALWPPDACCPRIARRPSRPWCVVAVRQPGVDGRSPS